MILMISTYTPDNIEQAIKHQCPCILMQDGVYHLEEFINHHIECYALERDFNASGILQLLDLNSISPFLINDQQWVNLCVEHAPVISIA